MERSPATEVWQVPGVSLHLCKRTTVGLPLLHQRPLFGAARRCVCVRGGTDFTAGGSGDAERGCWLRAQRAASSLVEGVSVLPFGTPHNRIRHRHTDRTEQVPSPPKNVQVSGVRNTTYLRAMFKRYWQDMHAFIREVSPTEVSMFLSLRHRIAARSNIF